VKRACKPDSVRRGFPRRDRHYSGPSVTRRLGATYPPALRNHIDAGLLGVAARRDCPFHPAGLPRPTRLCCS